MKTSKVALFIGLVLLIAAGMIWRLSTAGREAGSRLMEVAELVLTKAWTGEVVRLPGPLTVPQWMKETREYRGILRWGSVSDLTATDPNGNTYVAHALGRERDKAGKFFVCFSSMEKRRPDGSLENVTLLAGDSEPFEWKILDENGNRTMSISRLSEGGYTVRFFENNEDKVVKEWEVDPEHNIYSEQVRGEDGHYHFTHNMR
ncbi:MAG TPA: hypothetical protein VMX13_09745 [Sedimentisphaerales bacterium]|nr:hypothetical protein [Sedimentisphaerales bacterium]